MPRRKVPLANGEIYHIVTKSIAEFKVFNTEHDFQRQLDVMSYYTSEKPHYKFSAQTPSDPGSKLVTVSDAGSEKVGINKLVRIITYCLMPTHIHLVLQQLKENGISKYMNLILKSYSAYFNRKHNRKGPLWESRFKNILVEDDAQFLHLTRYIHLNPVTAHLVETPEEWQFSSYHEYLAGKEENDKICDFTRLFDMEPALYKKFVHDRIDYQRTLANIKRIALE